MILFYEMCHLEWNIQKKHSQLYCDRGGVVFVSQTYMSLNRPCPFI